MTHQNKGATDRQIQILASRGLKPKDVVLMREMWQAKEWEGHKVTVRMLAEIFLVTRRFVETVVKNESFKQLQFKKEPTK